MTLLITGARGKVGQALIARLHAAGLPVRAASADPAALTVPAGVDTAELRLDAPETFSAALKDISQVFLYAEPAGIDAFLTESEAAGVEHIVLMSSSSVLGPDAENDPLGAHHLTVEQALTASGIAATVLRPDAFASNALGWAWFISNGMPIQHPYPDAQVAPIHIEDIADIALAAFHGGAVRGSVVSLSGAQPLTFREQLAVISSVLGRDIPVVHITPEKALEQLTEHMTPAMAGSLLAYWAFTAEHPVAIADTIESLLGRPARSFQQWVRENADAFSRS